jgi:glycosyltransferase involved in cell wall biosynthesis
MTSKVVMFVGVLTEYQGIDLLLEAVPLVVQKVEHVKFVIVGYPNEQHYREKARCLQIEKWTHFTGKISYEDVPRYLSIADVAVSPKISTTEANLKLFSYMAMGLPTVVFDTPINREILGHVGVYAKMGDVTSLAEALIGLLTNHERSAELAKMSRQKAADEHSWSGVGRRLADIYNSIRKQPRNLSKEQQNGEGASLGYGRSRFHRLPFSKSPTRSGPRGHGPG